LSDERKARRDALQQRIMISPPLMTDEPRQLFNELRSLLFGAANEGALRTPPQQILKLLKLSSDAKDAKDAKRSGEVVVTGGEKNQDRDRSLAHFERDDGAWFDFAITVARVSGEPLLILGYTFEIRFPTLESPRFVRFDVNLPGHENEGQGLRSHLHPGDDDLQVPAPFMSPLEVLDLVIYGMRLSPGRKPRAIR